MARERDDVCAFHSRRPIKKCADAIDVRSRSFARHTLYHVAYTSVTLTGRERARARLYLFLSCGRLARSRCRCRFFPSFLFLL